MKFNSIAFFWLSLLSLVLAWSKDDYEIFDLVSDLEAAEGKGTTFYSHIGVEPSSSTTEINKAYRRKSLELHPDKNPGVKDIEKRFARLGVISQILRSPEKRERYNFFYKNGVPIWRGTGYYYSRYRPTLAHTLIFLVFLTSLFHLLVLRLNFNKDKRRVDYFTRSALESHQNGLGKKEKVDLEPGYGKRIKVNMVEGNEYAGQLELVVVGEKVYLPPDQDGSLTPLSTLANPPSYLRTWPFKLSLSLIRRGVALLTPATQASFPASFRPVTPAHEVEETVPGYEVKTNGSDSRKQRKKDRSRTGTPRDTPRDSPATSDVDKEDEDDVLDDSGGVNGEAKKKHKPGLGKSGGARRRKMALKR